MSASAMQGGHNNLYNQWTCSLQWRLRINCSRLWWW